MTYLEAEGGPTLILNQTTPDGNAEVAATMPETLSLLPTLTPPPPPPPPPRSPARKFKSVRWKCHPCVVRRECHTIAAVRAIPRPVHPWSGAGGGVGMGWGEGRWGRPFEYRVEREQAAQPPRHP